MIIPGRIPVSPSLQDIVNEVIYEDNNIHSEIANLFTRNNLLYNMSSTTEDIITARFMALYGMAKTIVNGNFDKKNYVIENFNSQEYVDTKFPIDNGLNIDTQNGVLSLPIVNMEDLRVSAIILESDSNGQSGNSVKNFINSDINAILSSNSSSLFEYEKIVNTFKATELYLAATVKLEDIQICNGIYLKLYADEDTQYPTIDLIETSNDGTRWIPIEYSVSTTSDYFIKFNPRRIRFMRIRFKQDSYKYIVTPFGTKYRYMIGIRQLVMKKIKYSPTGEYVSIPFSSRGSINNISMSWNDKSLGDIRYSFSANNGGKWLELSDSKVIEIINQDAGLRGDIDVDSVRVKIEMNRTSSPNSASETEYMLCNQDNSYFLKNIPVSISPILGHHISRGDMQSYDIMLQDISALNKDVLFDAPQCISDSRYKVPLFYIPYYESDPTIPGSKGLVDELIVKINGVPIRDDGSVWTILKHQNESHSILSLNIDALPSETQDAIGAKVSSSLSGTISISYKPYIHDHRYSETSTVILPSQSLIDTMDGFTVQMVNLIPEDFSPTDTITPDIFSVTDHEPARATDNDSTTYWMAETKNKENIWTFEFSTPDYIIPGSYIITPFIDASISARRLDYNPGVWEFQVKPENSEEWFTVDKQSLVDPISSNITSINNSTWQPGVGKEFKLNVNCGFRKFRLKIISSCENVSSLIDQQKIGMTNINLYSRSTKFLTPGTDFIVIDRGTLKIMPVAYDTRADYEVTYYPAVDISSFMTLPILTNRIDMQGLHKTPQNAKICFQYKYQDLGSLEEVKYYSPFCNEYRITLI